MYTVAKSAEVVIPGCLVAALISAYLQLEALIHVQEKAADGSLGPSVEIMPTPAGVSDGTSVPKGVG